MIAQIPSWSYSCYVYPNSPAQVLKTANTSVFLVSNLTNIRYLMGLELSAGLLLITSRKYVLFVDGRYSEVASKNAMKGVDVKALNTLKSSLKKVRSCGCESEVVTLAQFRKWKREFKNTKFVQKSGIIENFRRTKGPSEIIKFHKAQSITHALLKKIPRELVNGRTEKRLARKLRNWAEELGADSLSFDPIVAFGVNTSRPHHHPTNRKLKRGDIVQIDVGARYKGYCADQSVVFFTGPKTKKQALCLEAVQKAKGIATELVRAGVTTHELEKAARAVLKKYEYEKAFCHSLGHGVGLDIHEGVNLSLNAPKEILRKGEIITIEPGVYFAGQFGMRLEDEVIVK